MHSQTYSGPSPSPVGNQTINLGNQTIQRTIAVNPASPVIFGPEKTPTPTASPSVVTTNAVRSHAVTTNAARSHAATFSPS